MQVGKTALMISYANVADDAVAVLVIGVARDVGASRTAIGNVRLPRGLTVNWERKNGNAAAAMLSRVEPHGDPSKLPQVRSHADAMYERCVVKPAAAAGP
jgi:hypothetical protein